MAQSQQVDKRSDAIRKCGAEIVKLRKHIEIIDQERCRLDSQLKTFQRSTAEAEMVSKHSLTSSGSFVGEFKNASNAVVVTAVRGVRS